MVGINETLGIRVVSNPVRSQVEKTVVRIEHGSGKLDKEVTCKTSSICAALTCKIHMEASKELIGRLVTKLSKSFCENIVPLYMNVESLSVLSISTCLF